MRPRSESRDGAAEPRTVSVAVDSRGVEEVKELVYGKENFQTYDIRLEFADYDELEELEEEDLNAEVKALVDNVSGILEQIRRNPAKVDAVTFWQPPACQSNFGLYTFFRVLTRHEDAEAERSWLAEFEASAIGIHVENLQPDQVGLEWVQGLLWHARSVRLWLPDFAPIDWPMQGGEVLVPAAPRLERLSLTTNGENEVEVFDLDEALKFNFRSSWPPPRRIDHPEEESCDAAATTTPQSESNEVSLDSVTEVLPGG